MTPIPLNVHDGELRRIEIPGDSTITLGFESSSQKAVSLVLEGVEAFRCDGVLAGNIISGVWQIDQPTVDDLARVTCGESRPAASKPPSERDRVFLQSKLEAVCRGDLVFVVVESSYGCAVDVLCRKFHIAEK